MSDLNLEANMSQDGVTPYQFLMVYLDHFTKKINLTPLKRKSGEEVTEALLDIFCESSPLHILHSDNGREFSNQLLFSTLAERLPTIKLVHGKPQHPESQGVVQRANRDVKDALFSMMYDNGNDQCWVKYLRWVKFHKNITYHSTIKMSPFEAVYNKIASFGLSNLGIPHEFWTSIHTEDDLNAFQKEVCEPAAAEVIQSELSSEGENEFVTSSPTHTTSQETQFLSNAHLQLMNTRKRSVIHYHPAHWFPKTRLSILTITPSLIIIIIDHFQVQLIINMNRLTAITPSSILNHPIILNSVWIALFVEKRHPQFIHVHTVDYIFTQYVEEKLVKRYMAAVCMPRMRYHVS